MKDLKDISGYIYENAELSQIHRDVLPKVTEILNEIMPSMNSNKVFDAGCGNGSVANALNKIGYDITGIDPSLEGITQAREIYPHLKLEHGSAYEDLAKTYGQFPCVISLEVVEHVYAPRKYIKTLYDLVQEEGTVILSTPYHGYWKNLALAISGKMDKHFTALWDGGHIKFWSFSTLEELLKEVGFRNVRFYRVGRISPIARCMIAVAKR